MANRARSTRHAGPTTIRNVHERRIAADPEHVWDLLMTLSGPDDRLWPPGAPALRIDGPLAIGARGGHGPIDYEVTALDPRTGTLAFGFREPTGLVGHHAFHVSPEGKAGTLLRHELIAEPEGWMRLKWPLIVRWVHDAVMEELLDRAELATGQVPAQPHQRSRWVEGLLSLSAPRPRAASLPPFSSACEALTRVDWADAYRMTLRPHEPQDPEAWSLLMSDVSRRSSLLRLRMAGGRLLRPGAGSAGLEPADPFPILRRSSDEILVGLDDSHLNYRATIGVDRRESGRTDLVVTTAVMFHHAWGRRYMAIIKPIHRRLVPAYMRRARRAASSAVTPDGSGGWGAVRSTTHEPPA